MQSLQSLTHETNPSLVNRTTLWGSAINEVHPRNGENYFTRLRLTRAKEGAIDMLTGKVNEKSDGGERVGITNVT